jgi:lipopolysaccharide/colanic/teichoic acid biosynthesis glycosyltransferase
MSIVGPRPALPREVEQYNEYYRQRLSVIPGLTCYWQILKNRNDVSFDEWVVLDIQYIQERNFMKDMKIILKTVRSVLKHEDIDSQETQQYTMQEFTGTSEGNK